ncbi:hypothetical protein [Phaeobacter inhibens]|uniref:hypothetical protein n=1 Tax=Phaeobacter inhibens TaxID=221822 RepID=UPI000C9BD658|nr:hypothetical protein [Phaeobacter inhibens]AUQ53375.1 hypothetical protein PhaeoP92_00670 [Phaeobacter inhibens]AUQ77391.1 hypothetical protein PhaeoP74_00671 [Phaeobacter inhibens]AUR14550.1 hypothetical protein PhaeoP70_00669 [Phaeobacter inhibens]UWR93099.1 hypothetical protein K4K96_03310 [Phaeobacter inhibens]
MADESNSLFSGGPLPPPLTKAQGERKKLRDEKWNDVAHLRDAMTDEERQAEQERLAREVEAILAAREQDQRNAA